MAISLSVGAKSGETRLAAQADREKTRNTIMDRRVIWYGTYYGKGFVFNSSPPCMSQASLKWIQPMVSRLWV